MKKTKKELERLQNVVEATQAASEGLFVITIPEWNRVFTIEEIQFALDKAGININAEEVLHNNKK